MIKVYAIALALGSVGLVVLIVSTALSESTNGRTGDLGDRIGLTGKTILGAVLGFGMGGMAAEFSPLDLSWQLALAIAVGSTAVGAMWTRYAVANAES